MEALDKYSNFSKVKKKPKPEETKQGKKGMDVIQEEDNEEDDTSKETEESEEKLDKGTDKEITDRNEQQKEVTDQAPNPTSYIPTNLNIGKSLQILP